MSAALTIEQRVAILEQEMAQLKQAAPGIQRKQNWLEKIQGSFKNDPEFGEILRLSQEIRKADRIDDAGGDG